MRKLAILGMLAVAGASYAQVVNGGFEANATGLPTGWTGTQGSFSQVNQSWGTPPAFAHSGTNWYGMGATTAATQTDLSQTLATVVGQQYLVSFWAYENDTTPTGFLQVFFNGVGVRSSNTGYSNVYTQYSNIITATSTSTILNFQGWEATSAMVIDDISVTPVPEPASMAALGLGALALIRRRKAAKK